MFENYGFTTVDVFIVMANDESDKDHIIFTTFIEQVANDLVEALDDADTSCEYNYRVVKKLTR